MLDTHAVLWWFDRSPALSAAANAAIGNDANCVVVSAISVYEIAYKHRLGKLQQAELLLNGFAARMLDQGFELLDVDHQHALIGGTLDWPHKDPFDRMLVAQALVDDLTLVSNEALFEQMGVRRLW